MVNSSELQRLGLLRTTAISRHWQALDLRDRPDDRNKIAEILDEISAHEHAHGRPLLSAVVIYKGGSGSTPGKSGTKDPNGLPCGGPLTT